ncbi:MAG: bifunctional 2-C-methyl-D-erythritol 4-phosphate cytidylyltransferase/2-C-methyl-D-erythritol 2,4-cyclodiphosphate synthase [Pseudomonadota bacterium]
MRFAGLIVAAGRGTRSGAEKPKQYIDLGGKTVLRRAVEAVLTHPDCSDLTVVIHEEDGESYRNALGGVEDARLRAPVVGGASRSASVRAGLEAIAPSAPDLVLIHDGARPFVSPPVISGVIEALETAEGACPALPVVDALWHGDGDLLDRSASREGLWRAQTPQGFRFASILAAHRATEDPLPDDVAVARAAGLAVARTRGDEANFKITTPEDFARARAHLAQTTGASMDIRVGHGYDVHRFADGDAVTLCGIDIAHPRRLSGHSDADVAMHTITDAIFGALSEGDIGQWFPPSDPQWKGASSDIFLRKAVERVADRGARLTHLDCTIICEVPKIGPHAPAMRARIAEICGIDASRVSIKATTSERLGFTGREEGIAATATATVVFP